MKQFFGILIATLALAVLLGGCTSGGNVSDRKDGMIEETTGHGETHETTQHTDSDKERTDSGDLWDEEQEDDSAARSRRIVRRRQRTD